jgi:hypothetical protein
MNSDMRAFAVFLCVCLLSGCASKPEYYISPAPVTIPKAATDWLDTFNVEVKGKSKHLMSDEKARQQLGAEVLHFAQNRPSLEPSNWRGQARQWKSLGGVSSVERYFTRGLSDYTLDDLRDIPSC